MDVDTLLAELLEALNQMDDLLVKNDLNATLRKTHECIGKIKQFKGETTDVPRSNEADTALNAN